MLFEELISANSKNQKLTDSMKQRTSEANSFSANQGIPTFYETRMFITAFKTARRTSLPGQRHIFFKFHFNIIFQKKLV
jgi:hypothetical protein